MDSSGGSEPGSRLSHVAGRSLGVAPPVSVSRHARRDGGAVGGRGVGGGGGVWLVGVGAAAGRGGGGGGARAARGRGRAPAAPPLTQQERSSPAPSFVW